MKILIMAGGSGERFWPLSTKEKPKQLLSLFSKKTLIRETVDRVINFVDKNDIYVATNQIQYKNIVTELNDIPLRNIIVEPSFRDTAAAIAYGSLIISRDSKKDETIAVLASDHLISNKREFISSLKKAEELAKDDFIVTLGVKPTSPETGYGYIKLGEKKHNDTYNVLDFMEKPDYKTAVKYINNGNYVWNSGIFIFKHSCIKRELKKYIPNHVYILNKIKEIIKDKIGSELAQTTKSYFQDFKKISIDYAVLEKSQKIKCISVSFGWNDVGDLKSLEEILDKDKFGNVTKNVRYFYLDSSNNIVISDREERLVTSLGISNMIVVDTEHALLICKKNDSQKIKELLKKINRNIK